MMSRYKIFKRLVLILILSAITLFGANSVEVIRPLNKSIIDKDTVTLIVKIKDKSIDKLKFITEGGDIYEKKIDANKNIYCKTVPLQYGSNTIILRAYSNGKKKFQKMLEVFYKFPAYRSFKYPPAGFRKNYFHTTKNEQMCKKCHKMNSNEEPGLAFENPKDSNCYNCHKSLFLNKKYAHAPSVNWVCSSCHNKNKSIYTKYPAPREINKSCFKCHKKFRKKFISKKYKHEPVAVGRCSRCHDSHATPQKYFVRLEVRKLCTTCHGDKAAITNKKGSKCTAANGGSCTDCHNPHASNKPFMYEPGRHDVKEEEKKKKAIWLDE